MLKFFHSKNFLKCYSSLLVLIRLKIVFPSCIFIFQIFYNKHILLLKRKSFKGVGLPPTNPGEGLGRKII